MRVHCAQETLKPKPYDPRVAGGNNCRLWVTQPLMAGMIVSNEPGYYEDNAFGIRIENLLHIREADTPFKFGDQSYFGFERLTMIPLQRKMILTDVRRPFPASVLKKQRRSQFVKLWRFVCVIW